MAFATIDVTKGITGTIPVANGGTGLASGTAGQFLKFTGTTTLASAADNGKILSIAQTICSTGQDYTGTSYQNVFSASITPTSASNKIYLIATINYQLYSSSENFLRAIYSIRDNGESEITVSDCVKKSSTSDGREYSGNTVLTFLHSPNTTSSYTYYVSQKCVGSNRRCSIYGNNAAYGTKPSSITLIEVAP
tara:strand:+ start:1207 stop:1785 length:579 start_codon:yes stop_codon:yes gene_type:complete